jgi:hypothetical protein
MNKNYAIIDAVVVACPMAVGKSGHWRQSWDLSMKNFFLQNSAAD